MLRFYDMRRDQVRRARPNAAHQALASLEQQGFRVSIITQNIDDLHERAGSRRVLHLHGEILKARSTVDPRLHYPLPGVMGINQPAGQGVAMLVHHWQREGHLWLPETLVGGA